MARTAGNNDPRTALEKYEKLELFEQRLCYLFFLGKTTDNRFGLNADESPGLKANWKACGTVKAYIPWDNFRYRANKVALIAIELVEDNQRIIEPILPPKSGRKVNNEEQKKEEQEEQEDISDDPEYKEEPDESPKKKRKSIKKPAPTMPTVDEITSDLAQANLNSKCSISMPVVWGHFEYNTFTGQRKEVMVYKYRFLTHNFVNADDIDKLWLDSRTLQVRIASPIWWENPENQAMFETKDQEAIMQNEDGDPQRVTVKVPLYDLQHKLIGSMMTNNEKRKDDDGRIYDIGLFKFGCDMDQADDETIVELKPLKIKGVSGQFISIRVQVDYKTVVTAKKTPSKAKHIADDVSIGVGPTGKSIDPEGMKVGEADNDDEDGMKVDAVDEDYIYRFINIWEHYTSDLKTREEAVAAISPYVDSNREEVYLTLLHMLLESIPVEVKNINEFMLHGNGKYEEMFLQLRIHIREEVRVRDEAAATATTATTATMIDLPEDVNNSNDNLSVDNALFEEDNVHTIPQDIVVDAEATVDTIVNLEEDHEHAHEMKLHVQNRKEADHEKESSVREKTGSNKLVRRTTRSNSDRNILEDN